LKKKNVFNIFMTFDVAHRYNGCSGVPHNATTVVAACGAATTAVAVRHMPLQPLKRHED
jgi:hypothetical protein